MTSRTLHAALAFALSAPLLGCIGSLDDAEDGTGPTESAGVTEPSTGPSAGDDPVLDATPQGDAPPLDHPPIDAGALPQPSAAIRRLSLAQLRASLPVLFGVEADGETEITWHMPSGDLGLDAMAGSLGEPDWIEITQENLEPSPMYVKFMDDLARDVCDRALTADASRADATERVIARHAGVGATPADVDENLRYLLLRLHAVKVTEGDDTATAPWHVVFDEALLEADDAGLDPELAATEAWRAVCVGLVMAPEFHLY